MMRAKIDAGIFWCLAPVMRSVAERPIASFSSAAAMATAAVGIAAFAGVEVVENHPIGSVALASTAAVVALGGIAACGLWYLNRASEQIMREILLQGWIPNPDETPEEREDVYQDMLHIINQEPQLRQRPPTNEPAPEVSSFLFQRDKTRTALAAAPAA